MRARFETILAAAVALCVGVAAGWFAAARACGDAAVSSKPPYQGDASPACNNGRARSMNAPNEKAKPRRKVLMRSSADAEVQKRILENKIGYLEKCIAAAKVSDAKPAEKMRETNAEIVARLMKLPTDNERYFAFTRLDEKTQMSLTIGELKKICPRQMTIDEELSEEFAKNLDKMTEVTARRIGILDTLDPSGLNDEERRVHAAFMECLAGWPDAYAKMIEQPDSMTWGEAYGRIENVISHQKQLRELAKSEHEMLVAQTIKSFEIPDGDAVELRAGLDDVRDVTSFGYFEKKD